MSYTNFPDRSSRRPSRVRFVEEVSVNDTGGHAPSSLEASYSNALQHESDDRANPFGVAAGRRDSSVSYRHDSSAQASQPGLATEPLNILKKRSTASSVSDGSSSSGGSGGSSKTASSPAEAPGARPSSDQDNFNSQGAGNPDPESARTSYDYRPTDPHLDPPAGAAPPHGLLASVKKLFEEYDDKVDLADEDKEDRMSQQSSLAELDCPKRLHHRDSMASLNSFNTQVLDADDPFVTGIRKRAIDDEVDLEKNVFKQMDYKTRRKERERIKIEYNISSVLSRQKFLMRLSKALMFFGAPSHRIEAQLVAAARILELHGEFIHIPGVVICSFGDQDTRTSETHFVKTGGRLNLGCLHEVHQIYRQVVHDEISAKEATRQLDELLEKPPIYNAWIRLALAFCLCALICPLAFGGSFVDMLISGLSAMFLCGLQIGVASRSQLYANVFEVTVTIVIACAARGLSSIRSQIFCYTAISSAGIVLILPGYLILSSSLELASKNIVCGSVKMVYSLIYTLFLGFGLQIGSDFYLLVDRGARRNLETLSARMAAVVSVSGTFVSDNSTSYMSVAEGNPLRGTYTFTSTAPLTEEHIRNGCYRPPDFPWYLQPFPWWSQFIIVPIFSTLSSLANQQPLFTIELVVMVVISCAAYAANKVADHYIFNRSDVVSAIGAFAVGLLGNVYSRKMGGTAFTSMVTGVLFLVPSGLSQIGGITAQGNGIDIGGAMIAVTIGITVGLYMSQALVYMFGSRKNAALFSF